MIARYAGATLGLLGFTIAISAGLLTQNPVTVTLSRGIIALFEFCFIGLVLGSAAQVVVREYQKKRELEIQERHREEAPEAQGGGPENRSTTDDARPIGT